MSSFRPCRLPAALLGLLAVLALLPTAASAQGEPLDLTVLTTSIQARGVTPGGEVAWLGVSRGVNLFHESLVTVWERLVTDEDQDGVVTLELEGPAASLSVWTIVDVTSGGVAVAVPDGQAVRWAAVGSARPGTQGLELDLRRAEVLLVRPGRGAFRARVWDGGAADGGHPGDRRVSLTPAAFRAHGGTSRGAGGEAGSPDGPEPPGLDRFAGGDVVVALDSGSLQVILAEVGR